MAIPFRKSADAKRQEKVRVLLGPEHFRKKRWLNSFGRFVVKHYLSITLTASVIACAYAHIYYYNRLTIMKQQVYNLQAQIEAGLQMRQNIVVSLTAVVNRFISHESDMFTSAMQTRKDSMTVSSDLKKLIATAKEFSAEKFSPAGLSKLMAVAENYPQLVSSQPYKVLVTQIADTENQIYQKRNGRNDAANVYNTYLSTFPGNAFGRIMRFKLLPYFTWDNKAEWIFESENQNLEAEKQN